jgi:hypothetical protein
MELKGALGRFYRTQQPGGSAGFLPVWVGCVFIGLFGAELRFFA